MYSVFSQIKRVFLSVYEVVTITGDVNGAGTDANIFITLFGDYGITPKLHLASKNRTAFEKNKTDVFRIKTHNVGPLKKIRIEHDNTGLNASWFLDRVVVTDMNRPHLRFYFACNNWLSKTEGDSLFVRDLLGSVDPMDMPKYNKYVVSVFTADVKGSGTDADVFLNIFGENGDTGERRLDNDKNNFERGTEDKFTIEAPNLGRVRKITIGHNNKGSSAGWFVIVDDLGNKAVYEFPISRWFAIDEDDGKIQRDILVGGSQPTGIVYNVQVVTGNIRGAGTNSKIHMIMHGSKGLKNSGKIFLEGGKFERVLTDIFNVEIAALLSPLSRVTIGHDNGGVSAGWYCDKVVIFCPFTGIEQTFPCSKWLDEDEADGLIERELYEMVSLRQKRQKKHPWSLWIWTSDLSGAGTDASVLLQIYGEKGKSDEMRLDNKTDNFEQGQLDKFMIELPDLGKLIKLRIWHEKRNPFAGWHLSRMSIMKTLTKETYKFPCERWLDANEEDNEVVRELPATGDLIPEPLPLIKYRITVYTGSVSGGGTDAHVFLCLIGDQGDTGDRALINCKNNVNKFEKGNADEFIIEAVSIGQVRRVRIGHDGHGGGCGWFVDKVVVREEGQAESQAVEFPCNRWFDRNEDDGQIVRELVPLADGQRLYNVSYHIAVKTGNVSGGSSDSKVFVKFYGEKGDTSRMMLVVSDNNLRNYFEAGRVDVFTVETADIGQINRLLIGHTNEGMRAGWFLDSVQIMVPNHGKHYMFPSHRWLCRDEADGKTEVEIYPSEILDVEQCKLINYEITVVTGDIFAGGTNANVFIQIYGDQGKTEVLQISSRSNNYERGAVDIYKIEAKDVGKIFKIRISNDDSGVGAGWYLDRVEIKRLIMAMVPKEKKEDKKKKKNKKKKSEEDEDEEGGGEEMREVALTYLFPCDRWLASDEEDGEMVVELLPEDNEELEENTYEVHIFTGNMMGAGSDANVFINLYGENGDTGERPLRKSSHLNKFERGQEDTFSITAVELGPLKKLRIRHDNSNQSAWYLDRVEIVDTKDDTTYYFPCNRWLAVDEDDGQIARELVPVDEAFMRKDEDEEESGATLGLEQKAMSTTYTLRIKTGEKKHAGTDANIFAILYGENDDTGLINLKASKSHKNKFEKGMIDEFIVEAVDLGELQKLRIGHDNSGSAGWFLDWVEIDAPSQGQRLRFPCGRWLDTGEDDGAVVRDLYPAELQTELYTPFVPYEITTFTSDVFAAGTDADVFIVLYGQKGLCTQQKYLCVNKRERRMYFERSAEDMFIVELEDIGDVIEKIRIGHDNQGTNPGWHLDRVEIRRLLRKGKGSETTIFPCERWLAKSEDDGETVRELVPSEIITEKLLRDGTLKHNEIEVEDALETHTYKVSVRTGDMHGAGTDANVFLIIYGDLGDTGERKLSKSESNSNKFERGAVDKFSIEAVDLGQVYKIRIRHDNSLAGADWYLDQVEVVDVETEEVYMFLCERWLSTKKEDKRIERTFFVKTEMGGLMLIICVWAVIPYHFTVSTGDDRDASTTSRVYVIIMGPNDLETERLWLDLTGGKTCFAAGGMEHFMCYGLDVGEIKRVEVVYEVTVVTGDTQNAGTDTNIFITVFGANGSMEEMLLAKHEDRCLFTSIHITHIQDFARILNWISVFILIFVILFLLFLLHFLKYGNIVSILFMLISEPCAVLTISAIERYAEIFSSCLYDWLVESLTDFLFRIAESFRSPAPGWHLEYVDVKDDLLDQTFRFPCDRWLAKSEDDGQIMRELACANNDILDLSDKTKYEIEITTANSEDAETKENAWIILEGKKGRSKEFMMENSKKKKFLRGATDSFEFSSKNVGEIVGICLGHITKEKKVKNESFWHVQEVVITEKELRNKFYFTCDARIPLAVKKDQFMMFECTKTVESFASKVRSLVPVKYEIIVITGDVKEAATDANVFITLYGVNGDSGKRALKGKYRNLFERGRTDRFLLEMLDLGELLRIKVEHDDKGTSSGWYLECVEVTNTANWVTTIFVCGKWLDRNKADGQTHRVLYPKY
uniref:Lipoxygenase homology domains 1b n=1 Tax=Cyprinus carpio TaxID=7962 RepID=A0A8C1ZDH5_CYPCA